MKKLKKHVYNKKEKPKQKHTNKRHCPHCCKDRHRRL